MRQPNAPRGCHAPRERSEVAPRALPERPPLRRPEHPSRPARLSAMSHLHEGSSSHETPTAQGGSDSMSIVPYATLTPGFSADWLADPAEIAQRVGGTEFVPQGLRNNLAGITAALLYGAELGLGPMQSLEGLYVVNGRVGVYAEKLRAMVLRDGHELWIEEASITKVTVAGRRKDSAEVSRITWTLDDAKRAGLAGKQSWKMYPRQMLLARASAELARAIFPDAIGGLAAREELEDDAAGQENGTAPAPTRAPKTRQRRRTSVSAPATTPEQAPPPEPEQPPLPGEDEGETKIEEWQRKNLMRLFREKGITERPDRLAYASAVV